MAQLAASRGVTTAHSLDGMFMKDDRDVDILTRVKDQMPVDFVIYDQTFDLEKVKGYGLPRIGGCIVIDGSPPQYTAAYGVDYPSRPGTRGLLNYSDRELYEFVTATTKAGMQCAFHAIGDRAIDQIIYIYWQVHHELGIKHLRHRIEHFSVPSEKHIEMALEMNLIGTAQPAIGARLDSPAGKMCKLFVPDDKVDVHENFSIPMKAGVIMPGGSDSPVTPIDPLLGIECAVNAYNPDRRVSLDEALKMYTIYGAYAAHEEKEKGSIEVGKRADFVVLDENPYEKKEKLNAIGVAKTIYKGNVTYSG